MHGRATRYAMRRVMKKKRVLAALVLVGLLLLLTGCTSMLGGETQPQATMPPMTAEMFTDLASVSKRYNETDFEDTLESLTARFGEPEEVQDDNGSYWNFLDENNHGVAVVFFDDGALRSKMVYFEDIRQFADLSGASHIENVSLLDSGMEYEVVTAAFGAEGIEIMQLATDSGNGAGQYLMIWVSEDGGIVQALFNVTDNKLEQVSYSLGSEA